MLPDGLNESPGHTIKICLKTYIGYWNLDSSVHNTLQFATDYITFINLKFFPKQVNGQFLKVYSIALLCEKWI